MIFESLFESAKNGELILVNGGMCHWHLRRDEQITIREIIVLPEMQRRGIGTRIIEILKQKGSQSIFAKCPKDLPSNEFYKSLGFVNEGVEITKSGRELVKWRLSTL